MNLIELERALRQLGLGGMAGVTGTKAATGAGRSHRADRRIAVLFNDGTYPSDQPRSGASGVPFGRSELGEFG